MSGPKKVIVTRLQSFINVKLCGHIYTIILRYKLPVIFHALGLSKDFAANVTRMKPVEGVFIFILMYSLMNKQVVLLCESPLTMSAFIHLRIGSGDSTFSTNKASCFRIDWIYSKHVEYYQVFLQNDFCKNKKLNDIRLS